MAKLAWKGNKTASPGLKRYQARGARGTYTIQRGTHSSGEPGWEVYYAAIDPETELHGMADKVGFNAKVTGAKARAQAWEDSGARGANPIAPKSRQKRAKPRKANPKGGAFAKLAGKGVYIVMGEGIPVINAGRAFLVNKSGRPGSVNGTPGLFSKAQADEIAAGLNRESNPIHRRPSPLSFGMDSNGNKVIKLKTPEGSFSVQTNDNLPLAHRTDIAYPGDQVAQELWDYVRMYGTEKQKRLVRLYALDPDRNQNPIARKRRPRNPVPEGQLSKLRKATRLYEDFRDKPGTELLEMEQPDFSTGLVIGRLTAVEYDTVRGTRREDYRHKFKKHAAPLLCVTSDGKTLFTVQGNFRFTERGITDAGE